MRRVTPHWSRLAARSAHSASPRANTRAFTAARRQRNPATCLANSSSECSCSLAGYHYHHCRGINDGRSGNGASWIPGCNNAWAKLEWTDGPIDLVGWQTSRRGAYNNNWGDYGDRTDGTFTVEVKANGMWCSVGSFSRGTANTEKWAVSGGKILQNVEGIKFHVTSGGACIDEFIIYQKA